MQRYGQKTLKNTQKNGFFPPFVTPQEFFQKSGSVTFVPLWCPNFMQKIRKPEIFKDKLTIGLTNQRTWDTFG